MSAQQLAGIIYTVGEVLISLALVILMAGLLMYSPDQGVKLAASGVLTGVTVFWFQRRGSEASQTMVATLANGKLSDLISAQSATNSKLSELTGAARVVLQNTNGGQVQT